MNKSFDQLQTLLGPFPEKVSLDAQVTDSQDCGSYTRERVEYNVEAGERIAAFLLVPKDVDGRAPAIFCHHQHGGDATMGKSEVVGLTGDPNQAYAHELAERGYIAFAPDAIGFEERAHPVGFSPINSLDLANLLVQGRTLLSKALHDVSVGIDYLASRADIDAERIGFIGHSYGGRMALWAPAFDKRIAASVSNCGCVSYKDSLLPDAGVQIEFCVPGIMKWGDIGDVVKLYDSTALLISATGADKWSRHAQELYDYVSSSFSPGSLELKMHSGSHCFTEQMRKEAYEFIDRQFA